MTITVNKHGLPRTIPPNVKREVRRACGFGCVICGLAIVDYEHVDPTFADALVHDPEKIVLLCPGCHAMVTRKQWSKQKVKLARENPACLKAGHARQFFDFCVGRPILKLGETELAGCEVFIHFQGYDLLSVLPPEEEGAPFRLSGVFTDSSGNIALRIKDNEWFASSSAWDVEVVGPRITIREGDRKISLVLRADPPNFLVVEKMNMYIGGSRLAVQEGVFSVTDRCGRTNTMTGGGIYGARVAFVFL